jgi:hypothetical protein
MDRFPGVDCHARCKSTRGELYMGETDLRTRLNDSCRSRTATSNRKTSSSTHRSTSTSPTLHPPSNQHTCHSTTHQTFPTFTTHPADERATSLRKGSTQTTARSPLKSDQSMHKLVPMPTSVGCPDPPLGSEGGSGSGMERSPKRWTCFPSGARCWRCGRMGRVCLRSASCTTTAKGRRRRWIAF